MFVPPLKVQQYIEDGWIVLEPADEPQKAKQTTPPAELEETPVSLDEAVQIGRKSKKA